MRKSGYLFQVLLLTVLTFFINPASAQEMMVAKLSDSELSSVLPILKAEVTKNAKLMNALTSEQNRRLQLFLDIKSGKTDPLDWLKQYSKYILVPPDAKYEPACSRAVSLGSSLLLGEQELAELKSGAVPTAVFTLGKEIRSVNRQILGEPITQDSYERFMQNCYNIDDKSYVDIKSILDKTIGFYTKSGFHASYETTEDGPSRTTVIFYHPEDEGYVSGNVFHLDVELFNPNYPETAKQCRQHPLGPSIEIRAESKLLDKIFSSPDIVKTNDESTRNSLRKSGITEDRYALIVASLVRARTDSENPDAIEVPDFDFVANTAEEKEIAKTIVQMKADALARKNNITIYNKFKTELDPILDILQQYMY